MEISGILIAGNLLSKALGQLVKRSEPAEAAPAKPAETPAAQPAPVARNTAALREVLAQYDVTDISPRQFSEMIQKLYLAGALSSEEFQELSLVRMDLDLDGVGPNESLDLVDYYADKLGELRRGAQQMQQAAASVPAGRLPPLADVGRRLGWLEKFALIQSSPEAAGLDTLV